MPTTCCPAPSDATTTPVTLYAAPVPPDRAGCAAANPSTSAVTTHCKSAAHEPSLSTTKSSWPFAAARTVRAHPFTVTVAPTGAVAWAPTTSTTRVRVRAKR
jgi:hypothetical protein